MSEWRGLHNPERHDEMPLGIYGCWYCARNGDPHEDCTAEYPCYCCLAAEVEALRAQVQRVREVCDDAPLAWQEEPGDEPVACVYVPSILEALDGGSE